MSWEEIREHETRTFLVTPLLLALGWAEQQMKIEWKSIDMACFAKPFSGNADDDLVAILEAKGFSKGLDYAVPQAQSYAQHFPKCRVVIVTNGFCYKTFVRQDDARFPTAPSAYLNLITPRSAYPLDPDNVKGALDVVDWLLPGKLLRSP